MPITAKPAAVGFWSPTDKGKTAITWSSGVPAKVVRFIDGANETQFDGGPNGAVGKPDATLQLGHTYRYDVRRITDNTVVASAIVTTYDVHATLADQVVQHVGGLAAASPPQQIINLHVTPGVDRVRITFETTQPTIPQITCKAADGSTNVAFALLNGLQTKHTCTFGHDTPLPQNMQHTFTIVAAGHDLNGTPKDTFATGTFVTGSRHATVIFDTITVRKDSDDTSPGDIAFTFGAGDADTGAALGHPWPELAEQSISDEDGPVTVSLSIVMEKAPRKVWVRVLGEDDDLTIFAIWPPGTGVEVVGYPDFEIPSTTGESRHTSDYAQVTEVFDIEGIIVLTTFPIVLATGDFKLAFTVAARIRVDVFVPAAITFRELDLDRLPKPFVDLYDLGKTKMIWTPGGGNSAHLVGLGAEGAIYHKRLARERLARGDEGWNRLSGTVTTPVKAIAGSDGGLRLFAFDGKGGVLFQKPRKGAGERAWTKLGGHFDGPLAVAEKPDGDLDVFGLAEDGVVYHTSIRDGGPQRTPNDWQRIGSGVAGALTAFALPDGSVSVFALARDGQVLHKRLRRNHWTPKGTEWQPLGKAKGERLIVVRPVEEKGVGLATLAEDGVFHYLAWPDYPQGEPPRRWQDGGSIDAWLEARPPRVHSTGQRDSAAESSAGKAKQQPPKAARRSAAKSREI